MFLINLFSCKKKTILPNNGQNKQKWPTGGLEPIPTKPKISVCNHKTKL